MKLLPAITVVIFLVANTVSNASGLHEAVLKSVLQADRECCLHLRDGTGGRVDCTVRCRGLVARVWNDTVGIPAGTIDRFYRPEPEDSEYYGLTEQCLNEVAGAIPVEDSCRRANCAIQCYTEQYGQLQREAPKFVPFTELQHRRILRDCIDMLQISAERVAQFGRDGIEYYEDEKCLLRCFMLREGYYSDIEGPDMDRMSVQCEGSYKDVELQSKARTCVADLQSQYLDRCSLAYRIADECINGVIAPKIIFHKTIVRFIAPKIIGSLPSIPNISIPNLLPNITLPTLPPNLLPNITLPTLPTLIPTIPTVTPPSVTVPNLPTLLPTNLPTLLPTALPPVIVPAVPTVLPTALPTALPTSLPTIIPTAVPTTLPTVLPTTLPTAVPTLSVTTPATVQVPTTVAGTVTLIPPLGR